MKKADGILISSGLIVGGILCYIQGGAEMPTIKQIFLWLNMYGGAFSAISVLVAVGTFFVALFLQRNRHINNQLGLLKSLVCELNYLGGEGQMQIGSTKRDSHLHWYEEAFSKGGVPTHDMKDIDVNRYIAELDEEIKGKSTRSLKEFLLFIHDCVVMVNRWTDEFLKLLQSEDKKEVRSQKARKMYVFVKQPIERLKTLVPEAFQEINTNWFAGK